MFRTNNSNTRKETRSVRIAPLKTRGDLSLVSVMLKIGYVSPYNAMLCHAIASYGMLCHAMVCHHMLLQLLEGSHEIPNNSSEALMANKTLISRQ